jgi:hypothetical protein
MTDPRKDYQQYDANDVNTELHGDPTKDLEIRPEDIDQVKGGRARLSSDPCEGGEISKKLG